MTKRGNNIIIDKTVHRCRELFENKMVGGKGIITGISLSSVESQKSVIAAQRCSVENQKGDIAVQSQWQ